MKNEKSKNIRLCLVSKPENWMESFRENVGLLRAHYGWSVRVLSEKTDISENTLNNFLQGKTKDCDQSMAIKLAKVFNVTIDELLGSGTMQPITQRCVAMSAELEDHHRYVIQKFVTHQYDMHSDVPAKSKQISVLIPECRNGHLKTTNVTEPLNVDHLSNGTKSKACLGIRIPCQHYEPYYMQNEIILLAADRDGNNGERCVISHGGNLYLCIKHIGIKDGKKTVEYLSLMDKRNVLFKLEEIDDKIGYVIGFLYPDGKWGER